MMAMGMNAFRVPGNLMSLGALDFGLIVDGAVIIIENCLAKLAHRQEHEGRLLNLRERLEETMRASQEMIKPTVFGQAIILLALAPLLMFTGVEGKTFRSEEHTSELQSLMRNSYAVFCLKKKNIHENRQTIIKIYQTT